MEPLAAQIKGWNRRGAWDEPQLTRISKMYEELGFMIRIEPFRPEAQTGCIECIKENLDGYKVLYTKKKEDG